MAFQPKRFWRNPNMRITLGNCRQGTITPFQFPMNSPVSD
jgi:hypothetical protein